MSELERLMAFQLLATGLAEGVTREYRFHDERRWRFDFAWPEKWVALEIEGGAWVRGRHNRAAGFVKDCEKYSVAAAEGWRVLRVTRQQIESGQALEWVERALGLPEEGDDE